MHIDRIIVLHKKYIDVIVQTIVRWIDLNKKIASSSLFFPVDPSSSTKIGIIMQNG